MTSGQLLLRSLTEERTGEYTCIVEAVTGISATSAYVKMGHKPVILSHDDDVTIIRSYEQQVTLNCPVTGAPTPSITWYKDDVELTTTAMTTNNLSAIVITDNSLVIGKATAMHAGS